MTGPFSAHGHGELAVDERRARAARRRAPRAAGRPARAARAACRGSRRRRRRAGTPGRRSRRRRAPAKTTPSSAAACVRSASEAGVRIDLEAAALDEPVDLARDRDRERELAACGRSEPIRRRKRSSACSTGTSLRLLVDQVEPLGGAVEDDAEVGADRADEPLRLRRSPRAAPCVARRVVARERVRRDRLDAERPEHERQDERRGRVAVVDDDPEAARADRLDVERARAGRCA